MFLGHFQPVHDRHFDVGHHHVVVLGLEHFQPFPAVVRYVELGAAPAQVARQRLAHLVLVLDVKNGERGKKIQVYFCFRVAHDCFSFMAWVSLPGGEW